MRRRCRGVKVGLRRDGHVNASGKGARERSSDPETAMAQNRLLDDFARLFTDAAGMAQGVRREAEGVVRAQFERFIRDMDVVSREEFEAVREMAILARDENDRLAERITALEARLAAVEATSKS
jgi:BMFP domain-containing protein YqiC